MWIKEKCEGVSAHKRDTKKKGARKETRGGKGSTLELQDKNNMYIFGQIVYEDYHISAGNSHSMNTV